MKSIARYIRMVLPVYLIKTGSSVKTDATVSSALIHASQIKNEPLIPHSSNNRNVFFTLERIFAPRL